MRLVSHDQILEFAASIIILKTAYQYVELFCKRTEKKAATFEYNDYRTSPERKILLVQRYPDLLVPSPDHRFFAMAREDNKENRIEWKYWLLYVLLIGLYLVVKAFFFS